MGVDRPPGSSRALRLDPHALPVRYAARDGGADGQVRNIELDRERVVLRRAVRGIPHEGRRAGRANSAASRMRTLPPEGGEPAAVAVMLEHRDSALTVPLFVADRRRRGHGGMEKLEPRARRAAAGRSMATARCASRSAASAASASARPRRAGGAAPRSSGGGRRS